jgi:hypothetical protein
MKTYGRTAMLEQYGSESIGLPRGKTLRILDGAGALLFVREGEVWLTQEGDTKDHILTPGQSFRLDRDGTALVYSFRRSVLGMSRPRERSASPLHRFWSDLVAPAHPKSMTF